MISVKQLENRVNELITAGNLTELQITQLLSIPNFLNNAKSVVQSISDLPDPIENEGRLVYVIDEEDFYFTQFEEWTNDFDSSSTVTSIVYSWGDNGNGKLGDGTTSGKSSPVTVIGAITNWSQVSGGGSHSLGVTDTGIAYAWGAGLSGRLGDGTTADKSSPVTVIGGITDWSQVSGGFSHSLGVTDSGIAYAWGNNFRGFLGDGTTTARLSPVTVVGEITNWSQVSAGNNRSLGVTDDGIAYGWGDNGAGRLGDGTTINRSSPVTVISGITNWTQVSSGDGSLGVTDDGIAYAWGSNNYGELGDGTTTNRSSPVTVIGAITNWSQVSGGDAHSLGIVTSSKGFNE